MNPRQSGGGYSILCVLDLYKCNLKRNVIAWRRCAGRHVFGIVVRRLIFCSAAAATSAPTTTAATATTTPGALARTEHLHLLGGDTQLRVLLAVFLPAVELQPALDQNGRALAEIFVRDFSRAAPERYVDKRCFIDPLVAALDAVVHSQADIRNGRSAWDVSELGVARKIADEDDAIKACHGIAF